MSTDYETYGETPDLKIKIELKKKYYIIFMFDYWTSNNKMLNDNCKTTWVNSTIAY